jgi:hypothetical protein
MITISISDRAIQHIQPITGADITGDEWIGRIEAGQGSIIPITPIITIINESGIPTYIARDGSPAPMILSHGQAATIFTTPGKQETFYVWNLDKPEQIARGAPLGRCVHRETIGTIPGRERRLRWVGWAFRPS